MPRLIFVTRDGARREIDVQSGITLMEAATRNDIDGILGDCGGACSCATCHVYVDQAWIDKIPERSDMETDMLDCVENLRPNSRLACQITVAQHYDGLSLAVPES